MKKKLKQNNKLKPVELKKFMAYEGFAELSFSDFSTLTLQKSVSQQVMVNVAFPTVG